MLHQNSLDSSSSVSSSPSQRNSRLHPKCTPLQGVNRIKTKCPYVPGNRILLSLGPRKQQTKALITHVFEPFTLSCTLVARFCYNERLAEPMVLKLFDRRFATQLRRNEHATSWTLDSEMQYRKFIENGGAAKLITNMEEAEGIIHDRGSTVENETYLHYSTQNLYKTERNAYCILKQLQGKRIPQLICTLGVPVISGLAPKSIQEHTAIPGLLLQHIDGVHLSDLSAYAPQSHWQSVCDQALNTINKITDEGVLNTDVKPRNFMVCKDPTDGFKVFMFDFGLCHFHWDCNNDDHFWKWKAAEDEEGSLGRAMERNLKEGFVYRRSDRQEELDRKYMME